MPKIGPQIDLGSDAASRIAVFLIAFILFAQTLSFELVWDDRMIAEHVSNVVSWRGPGALFLEPIQLGTWANEKTGYYRPMVLVSFWMNSLATALVPFIYHLTNVLLHALNTTLTYSLARRLGLSSRAALLGALFFAIHPVQAEAVSFVSGRADLLSGTFTLLTLLIWTRFREERPGIKKHAPWLCVPTIVLAGLSKETGYLAPLVLVLWGVTIILLAEDPKPASRRSVRQLVSISAVGLVSLTAIRYLAGVGFPGGMNTGLFAMLQGLWNVPVILATYSQNLIFPFNLSAYYSNAHAGFSWFSLFAATALLLMFLLAAGRAERHVGLLGGFWFMIFLSPTFFNAFGPASAMLADRYLYMPIFGLAAVFGCQLDRLLQRVGTLGPVALSAAAVFVLFALLTLHQSAIWEDELALFRDLARTTPDAPFVYKNLGANLGKRGMYEEAIDAYKKGLKIAPEDAELYFNLGFDYENLRKYPEAVRAYKQALRFKPDLVIAKVRLAVLDQGRENE